MAYFETFDHLGSVREMLDGSGTIQARYGYDPYGKITKISGSLDSTYQFAGLVTHAPSGNKMATWRILIDGRFPSRDPVGENGGINLYGYVGNDPASHIDPLGLAWDNTQSQGIHYNDRGSDFGFGLGTDANGQLTPTPLGGTHTFDAKKANEILAAAIKDKNLWNDLKKKNAENFDNPSYGDKGRCRRLGKAMRIAGVFGLLAYPLNAAASPLAEHAKDYIKAEDQQEEYNAAVQIAGDASDLGMTDEGAAGLFFWLDQ